MADTDMTAEQTGEIRERLAALKVETKKSWRRLAQESGIPEGTLSGFGVGSYAGDVTAVAARVERFLSGRARLSKLAPGEVRDPGFLETPTAQQLTTLLQWGQTGEIVAIATSPGTGKTATLLEYQRNYPNVWVAPMSPSTSGLQPMLLAVLAAMGTTDVKGSPQQLSARIVARAANSQGLIAIDEAQELSERALDEIRSWHDRTGIGIALVGDERVIGRLGGIRRAELGRLHSRISMRHVQAHPKREDAAQVIAGWGITDAKMADFLASLRTKPGGLRGIAKTIKLASLMAAGDGRAMALSDLREAWEARNTERMGG